MGLTGRTYTELAPIIARSRSDEHQNVENTHEFNSDAETMKLRLWYKSEACHLWGIGTCWCNGTSADSSLRFHCQISEFQLTRYLRHANYLLKTVTLWLTEFLL